MSPSKKYEIIGSSNIKEIDKIINDKIFDNPIEDHFIKGQAYEHTYNNNIAAAEEYEQAVQMLEAPNLRNNDMEFINLDTIINRIEDFMNFIEIELPEEPIFQQIRENIIQADEGENIKIRSDPQNVHDSTANSSMRAKYDKICCLNGEPKYDIMDVLNDIGKDSSIKKVIMKMIRSPIIISSLQDTEENILINVYQRIKCDANKNNYDNLRESLISSLKDCIDKKDSIVCSQGRVSRIIESLTCFDSDEKLSSSAKTDDILKSEIMSKAHNIIQNEISNMNIETKELYDKGDISVDDYLKNTLREKLSAEYSSIIDREKLSYLIKQAEAGI